MEFNSVEIQENCVRKLKQIRMLKGYTQEQFAERVGISLSAYKKIEEGINNVSVELLCQVKKITGFSIDYLTSEQDGDLERAWAMVVNCNDYDKWEIIARLIENVGIHKFHQIIEECKGDNEKHTNSRR